MQVQLSNSAILARMLSCNTRSWVHHPGLVSHYPPAIKRGNGKSPRNGGLDGKIVLLLLTPCMDGQQGLRLCTPGIHRYPQVLPMTAASHTSGTLKASCWLQRTSWPRPQGSLGHYWMKWTGMDHNFKRQTLKFGTFPMLGLLTCVLAPYIAIRSYMCVRKYIIYIYTYLLVYLFIYLALFSYILCWSNA